MESGIITAWATVALAVLAFASALYARRLWLEARKQFTELKRSTDLDIALRMLARCDEPEVKEAEQGIGELFRAGLLRDLPTFENWATRQSSEARVKISRHLATIFTTYEHVGLVVRKAPETAEILIDYLSLRAPELYDQLRPFTDEVRKRSHLANCEFEALATACRVFANQGGATPSSGAVPPS